MSTYKVQEIESGLTQGPIESKNLEPVELILDQSVSDVSLDLASAFKESKQCIEPKQKVESLIEQTEKVHSAEAIVQNHDPVQEVVSEIDSEDQTRD